jgi:outer membrane PBP1 activator LpoA protein
MMNTLKFKTKTREIQSCNIQHSKMNNLNKNLKCVYFNARIRWLTARDVIIVLLKSRASANKLMLFRSWLYLITADLTS